MKIKVRTLQNNEEEINVDNDDTILDVKKKVESVFPEMAFDKQKLIFSGNILIDENKVVDILKENDIVIVMASKKIFASNKNNSKENANDSSTNSSAPKINDNNSVHKNDEKNKLLSNKNEIQTDEGKENVSINNAESMLFTGVKLKETIDNICAMGFERETVRKAMILAYNNPNRAIDYLTNGFPDINELNEINEINEVGERNEMGENTYERDNNENSSNLSNQLMNYNLLGDNSGLGLSENPELLRNSPFINVIRDVALSNPQRIPEILEMIGRTDPSFLEYIRENQTEFLRVIQNYSNENTPSADNEQLSSDVITQQGIQNTSDQTNENLNIPITPLNENEMESVKKLESLGFPKHLAIEAFSAY
ncbi:DNA repair protein RAD23, putative [Plasmodium malariae]|uniref:UV excision repair protein RAD23 n=1 Tax=Plasmodium malariae TaxID=5858 RepID=A0A1C3KY79_PLAMA|nr:DNA repair protein RAD23, putative [Plasmodium malariae]